jgi:HAD superfamily hydrolase (TIGR01549 family)
MFAKIRRTIYEFAKKIYWSIPPRYRQRLLLWSYRNFGFFFKSVPNYRNWKNSGELLPTTAWYKHHLIDIDLVEPARNSRGSVAIHIHIYYHDLAKEFVRYLRQIPFPYDLFISVANDEDLEGYRHLFLDLPFCSSVEIKRVPNKGRDIAPMFCTFGRELSRHDFIAHIHTKKSLYNLGATAGWREYLFDSLFSNKERIQKIFTLMQAEDPCGIVYPQNYIFLPYWVNSWLANQEMGDYWAARIGLGPISKGYFDYPAGSMFWARRDALAPLFEADIHLADFQEEAEQTDGTLAHCLERLLVLCAQRQGFRQGIIKDNSYPSWSAWRFDLYTNRSWEDIHRIIHSSQVKLIAFDIFDTLLCRPLLDPETVKTLVSLKAGGEAGRLYQEYRAMAESQARQKKGSDVGLDEIYFELGKVTRLSAEVLTELKQIEEDVEASSLQPRQEAVELYRQALATGKPVVLVSDMFLPRDLIEKSLQRAGIDHCDKFFLSNEIGLRKENGDLYRHVLAHYEIEPAELLMVGDNERSDIQVPCDMGASFIHLLRPVELARGLPRFFNIISEHERRSDIDAELTLGLVLRKNFSPVFYPEFEPDSIVKVTPYNWGYSLVGPLLVSFVDWLLRTSRADGIRKLYFLSREGKIIQQAYDSWCEGIEDHPNSEYLIASRRAAGVAAITGLEDILDIAKTNYYQNTLENFLLIRYGLTLSEEKWQECDRLFNLGRDTLITVLNRQVKHLAPLLEALEPEIKAQAEKEREAFLHYLEEKGLGMKGEKAVVDIGYGGSVQGYLNKLLSQEVHGYYMMTDVRSQRVARLWKVLLRGCFVENSSQSADAPLIYLKSFNIEKLLSSNEAQVEFYEPDDSGKIKGHFRDLTPMEQECAELRNELQKGALEYIDDARQARETMVSDFQPSCRTALMLMEAFLVQHSPHETELLSSIVLDDHYCGRDLVS